MSSFRIAAREIRIGDALEPCRNGAVLVEAGRIVAAGPDATVPRPEGAIAIDLGAATLLPGLIDAHMHTFGMPSTGLGALNTEREPYRALRAAGELRELLHAGFTSARCLGSSVGPDLRRAIDEGHIEGPRLVVAGQFISSTGGTWDAPPLPSSWARGHGAIADGADAIVQAVRERARSGADFIKLGLSKGGTRDRYHAWGDDPFGQVTTYSVEEVRAAVGEAHRNGMLVSAHAIGTAAVNLALDGGVDIIEHGYAIDDATRDRLVDAGKIVVTTISQLYFHRAAYDEFGYPQWERDVYERHWQAMRRDFELGLAAGIPFALGTDLIGRPTHPLASAAKEFELAVEWGMAPDAALRAGTIVAARALGLADETGSVVAGKSADLVAIAADTGDLAALASPVFVMKQGEIVRSAV
ncbi:Xaa-Pro dipeptidase [Kaistia sp. 32K]|uniref:metal-dependent hydrolase family protein n=1 Tax=Kaistia sp. 32K TaxID=2795690 RepID=UPI0019155149|nr:amidohydrolase family protein [Kaistia sp. 32K]BCP55161.1 Xaa-Pro dipeptidase [Kaistia sp. 32K]